MKAADIAAAATIRRFAAERQPQTALNTAPAAFSTIPITRSPRRPMPNSRTPAHLVQRFGLQPEYPAAKISGVWEGFRPHAPNNEDAKRPKKEFLSVHWALEFLGGIKLHVGGDANWEKRIPLVEFARFWGVDVSTACRRLGMFTPEDGRWDQARRRRMSEREKARALKEGRQLTGRTMRSVERVKQTLNKNAGYGQAQFYTLHMRQDLKPRVEEGKQLSSATENVEMMAQAFGADWFDPAQEGVNNYKWAPGWIKDLKQVKKCICQAGQLCLLPGQTCPVCDGFGAVPLRYGPEHERAGEMVPLYDYGKNLFFHLVLKGLLQYGSIDNQRLVQEMEPALGMDQATIAEYRNQLELLKIIRVRAGDITRLCLRCDVRFICRWRDNKDGEGKWVGHCHKCGATAGTVVERKPDVWIYIADKVMDEETVERERQRFQDLRAKVDADAFARAEKVHLELLAAWRGREHSLIAFFKEMRRRLASEGLNKNVLNVLFPLFRE
jgi:hypothetical protein